jgi:hypothetical protein
VEKIQEKMQQTRIRTNTSGLGRIQKLNSQNRREKPSTSVSNMRNILGSYVKLLNDKNYLQVLQSLLEKCNYGEEMKLEHKRFNQVCKKRRTRWELRLNANIGDFNMGEIILYLGSEVIFFPKNTWKDMGEPTLRFSPIQLNLENQHRVVPDHRLSGILVDLDGVRTMAYFEVIEIVDNTSPYPTLLGLDCAFDKHDVINLKTRNMIFELG